MKDVGFNNAAVVGRTSFWTSPSTHDVNFIAMKPTAI